MHFPNFKKFKSSLDIKKVVILVLVGACAAGIVISQTLSQPEFSNFPIISHIVKNPVNQNPEDGGNVLPTGSAEDNQMQKFASKEELVNYLSDAQAAVRAGYGGGMAVDSALRNESALKAQPLAAPSAAQGIGGGGAERVSETNVQVAGIDEPDIVKTDGKEIYLSSEGLGPIFYDLEMPMAGRSSIAYPYPAQNREVKLINGFPPENLKQDSRIEDFGNLLLQDKILVVFSLEKNALIGYDVSDPSAPAQKWSIELEDNTRVVSARLFDGKIYLVTSDYISYTDPCPMPLLRAGGKSIVIPCENIYHPRVQIPADTTYTALQIDPASGNVQNTISFIGSSGSSIVYMSENSLYVSYSYSGDVFAFLLGFLQEKGQDLVPASLISRLEKVNSYDLSQASKLSEFSSLLQNFYNSLSNDERKRIDNEFSNRMDDYSAEHSRELVKTGLAKIALDGFAITATGNVPGTLLNQFSMDEYQGYLRIVTTIGGRNFWGFGLSSSASANDVYVLDANLKETGSVKDLGLTEQVYSARFVQDRGYVVTFRQTDPFYVLDLSDPKSPVMRGELKIPGFSSYLHPLKADRVVGIGQESGRVKVSLFDVSDAANPKEVDKYSLDEYWTDVSSNHHAFLLDAEHEIFFLPAGQSGYILSYKNDELKLERVVSDISAERAIYMNDFLYVIANNQIVVLNENDWSEVKRLKF